MVTVWYAEANIPAMELMMDAQRVMTAARGPLTVLAIAQTIPKAPTKETAEWLKDQETVNPAVPSRGTIIAITAKGLGAVFARSFIAVVSLFSKQSHIVVKDLKEAVRAIQALPGQDATLVAKETLVADLEAFAAMPPPVG